MSVTLDRPIGPRDINQITNGSIFIERPFKVLKLAFNDRSVSFKDRLYTVARAIQAAVFALIFLDTAYHAGHLAKEDGRIFLIHTSGGRPVKEEAPQYFLQGCDWIIPNREMLIDFTDGKPDEYIDQLKKNAEEATNPTFGCKTDVLGTLLTPFSRMRKSKEDDNHNYFPESGQKFTDTELVARVWESCGAYVVDQRYKMNKIFPSDILKFTEQKEFWCTLKA